MLTNADMTIYNRKANPTTKKMEYVRTVIKGVWWHTKLEVSTALSGMGGGLKSADVLTARIPMDGRAGYLPPDEYAALTWGDHTGKWTVENGDIVVKGEISTDITRPAELGAMHLQMFQVVSHSENFFGGNQHIRIGGA